MSDIMTKSMARNVFYGGSIFFRDGPRKLNSGRKWIFRANAA